jgi:hypothetical protein
VPGDLVLKGDNVAQVAVLHNREAGASVVVANTHILYAPARGDVKLLQLKRLFRTLEQVRGHLSLVVSMGLPDVGGPNRTKALAVVSCN